MRRFVLGLAGFAVIACAASLCYAGDDEAKGLSCSLNLNELFGMPVQEGEKPAEAKTSVGFWGQMRGQYSGGTYNLAHGEPTGGNEDFSIWRFRFLPKAEYDWLTVGLQYETMSTVTLLDCWAEINCKKYPGKLKLKIGQFIPPFGIQRPISPYAITTINYSKIVAYLFGDPGLGSHVYINSAGTVVQNGSNQPVFASWGNLRDQGALVHGTLKLGQAPAEKGGFQPSVYYGVGLFRGEAANAAANSDPAWNFFFVTKVTPVDGMTFGISYEDGSRQYTTGTDRNMNRDRFGICWQLNLLKDPGLSIDGEWIRGNNNAADFARHENPDFVTRTFHSKKQDVEGWYIEVGLYVKPKKVQLLFKVDQLDLPAYFPGTNTDGAAGVKDMRYRKLRMVGFGLNWFISKHCKLQIMFEASQDGGRGKIKRIAAAEQKAYAVFGVKF